MDGKLIDCPHWRPHPDAADAGVCSIGKYDKPSLGVCRYCLERPDEAPMRGMGDLIALGTRAIGIKPCGGCKKRQVALNRALPFGQSR